jgi:hypothetical protein
MKIGLAILTCTVAFPVMAQVSRTTAPRTSTAPVTVPPIAPSAPVGPGSANNPPVINPPPTVGQTFQRPIIGGAPASATTIDPAASVPPVTVPPITTGAGGITTPNSISPLGTNVPGTFAPIVPGAGLTNPVSITGTVGTNSALGGAPNDFTFNLPPGSTIITNSMQSTQPGPVVPGQAIAPSAVGNSGRIQTGSGREFRPVPPVTQPVPSTRLRTLRPETTQPTP